MIKKVAVPLLKHSPMLGQDASSQTVLRLKSRKTSLTVPTRSHWGALTLNQSGFVILAVTRTPQMKQGLTPTILAICNPYLLLWV
jgi:hypothetical protein